MRRDLPDYDELEIRLTPGREDAYNVEVESASGARGRGRFSAPAPVDIERFRRIVDPRNRRVRGRSRYLAAATQFGEGLFEELVGSTSVRDVYTTARHDASVAGRGLRLTLSLRAAPELASIPWEFLYDRPRFLAQHVNSPVVRFVDLENPPPPLRMQAPLRVLGMVSRPKDDELATLDAEEEQAALERSLRPLIETGMVTLRWLSRATLPALQQEVDHGEEFHVFHYIGHGELDEETGDTSLILEHADRRPRRVGGQQLGALLCDRGSLRLAVLNACEAAQTAPQDPLAGIATSLMEYGVPAVVAMQFAITDDGALTFADEFYGALADGYAVDAAVTQGRRALAADSDVEWGTPVLFMRVADGRLFDLADIPPPPQPKTAKEPEPKTAKEPEPKTAKEPEPEPVSLTDPDESRGALVVASPERSPPAATARGVARDDRTGDGEDSSGVGNAGEDVSRAPIQAAAETRSTGSGSSSGGAPSWRRRRVAVGGVVLAAVAIAGAIAAIIVGGGGSGGSPVTVISENPEPAVRLLPVHGLIFVDARETAAPGGYRYRLVLSRVKPPSGASVNTPVSYYFTLSVRRGNQPFVVVHRVQLPYPFTASSTIADFRVDPYRDGSATAALSWYAKQSDKNDITHYFELSPSHISLD